VVLSGAEGKHDHRPWRRCCRVPLRIGYAASSMKRATSCAAICTRPAARSASAPSNRRSSLKSPRRGEITIGSTRKASTRRRSARRRSTRRGGPWVVSSAMPSALVRPTTSSLSAKATRRCCCCAVRFLPCRWLPLSANHLAALLLPPTLRRLYIARDADAAGEAALAALTGRADAAGIEAFALSPQTGDFNEDLRAFGLGALRAALRIQLAAQDIVRFMRKGTAKTK